MFDFFKGCCPITVFFLFCILMLFFFPAIYYSWWLSLTLGCCYLGGWGLRSVCTTVRQRKRVNCWYSVDVFHCHLLWLTSCPWFSHHSTTRHVLSPYSESSLVHHMLMSIFSWKVLFVYRSWHLQPIAGTGGTATIHIRDHHSLGYQFLVDHACSWASWGQWLIESKEIKWLVPDGCVMASIL